MSKGYICVVSNKQNPSVIKIVRTPARPHIKAEDIIGIKDVNDVSTIVYYAFFKNYNKVRHDIFKLLNKNKIKQRRKLILLTKKLELKDVIELISKMKGRIFDKNLYKYIFENVSIEEIHNLVEEEAKVEEPIVDNLDEPDDDDDSEYTDDDYEKEMEESEDEIAEPESIQQPLIAPNPIIEQKYEPKIEIPKIEQPKPIKTEPQQKKKKRSLLPYIILLLILILGFLSHYFKLKLQTPSQPEVIIIQDDIKEVAPIVKEEVVVETQESYNLCDLNNAIKDNEYHKVEKILSGKHIDNVTLNISLFDMNKALLTGDFENYVYNYNCEHHPLLTAIYYNSTQAIDLLMKYNQNAKFTTFGDFQTPLMTAIRLKANLETIGTLLKYFNVNDKNKYNETALMFLSIYNPDYNILKLFINADVLVDERDNDGNTALVFALKKDRELDFITLLLNNTKGDDRCYLKRLDNNECIKLTIPTKKSLLLITAIKYKANIKTIEFLIKNGADVNFFDYYGKTPINYAKRGGEVYNLLIKRGAIVD